MQSQSEILGFDTSRFSNTKAKTSNGIFDTFKSVFGKATGVLSGVFDNGVEIYGGVAERIKAIKLIEADIVEDRQVQVVPDTLQTNAGSTTKLIIAGLTAVVLISFLRKK